MLEAGSKKGGATGPREHWLIAMVEDAYVTILSSNYLEFDVLSVDFLFLKKIDIC